MKLCQHSYAADGSDLIVDKAPSGYRHFAVSCPFLPFKEREWSQGFACEAGAVYAHARRAGGINSTLDVMTRITLLSRGMVLCSIPLPPRRGESGVKGTGPLAGS